MHCMHMCTCVFVVDIDILNIPIGILAHILRMVFMEPKYLLYMGFECEKDKMIGFAMFLMVFRFGCLPSLKLT